jgi:hypothetical protein
MAAQRRPAPSRTARPAASRTAASRTAARTTRRRAPRRASRLRWVAPTLLVAAAALLAGTQVAPVVVQLTAAGTEVTNGIAGQDLRARALPDSAVQLSTSGEEGTANSSTSEIAGRSARDSRFAVPQPPRPVGVQIDVDTAYGVSPTYTPRPDPCGSPGSPRRVTPDAVAGAGSATVTWLGGDRAEVLSYRVSAVSQTLVAGAQAAPVSQVVAKPATCSELTATLTGLTPGDAYVIWMEEETRSPSTGVARMVHVGTSAPVVIG